MITPRIQPKPLQFMQIDAMVASIELAAKGYRVIAVNLSEHDPRPTVQIAHDQRLDDLVAQGGARRVQSAVAGCKDQRIELDMYDVRVVAVGPQATPTTPSQDH